MINVLRAMKATTLVRGRLVFWAVLPVVLIGGAAPATAAGFAPAQLDEITEHLYRGGGSWDITGAGCGTRCEQLWSAEHDAMAGLWAAALQRELLLIRQRVGLLPGAIRIPLEQGKSVVRLKIGVSGRLRWVALTLPPPADGAAGEITHANLVLPHYAVMSGGGGITGEWEVRPPVLGWIGMHFPPGLGVDASIVDHSPGSLSPLPPCQPSQDAPLHYAGWGILRGPVWGAAVTCGTKYQHGEMPYVPVDTVDSTGLAIGALEDFVAQPFDQHIDWWSGMAGNWTTLRAAIVAELSTHARHYPILRQWYDHQFDTHMPAPTDDPLLAERFKPVLRFDTGERWRPLDVAKFFEERDSLGVPLNRVCVNLSGADADEYAPSHAGPGPIIDDDDLGEVGGSASTPEWTATAHCADVESAAQLSSWDSPDTFVDVNGAAEDHLNEVQAAADYRSPRACVVAPLLECLNDNSVAYYTVGPTTMSGYRHIAYWFFYRFNDWGGLTSTFIDGDHEGDWESVEVAVSGSDPETFDYASFSGHGEWFSYLRSSLECDDGAANVANPGAPTCQDDNEAAVGTRVRSYVAKGSHANYPRPCSGGCLQAGEHVVGGVLVTLPEQPADGKRDWHQNYVFGTESLKPVDSPWYAWPGLWGVEGGHGEPKSPGLQEPDIANWRCARTEDPECVARPSRVAGRSAAARAQRRRNRRAERCRTWFGPGVAATLCGPELEQAARERRLGTARRPRLSIERKARAARRTRAVGESVASVVALDQAVGRPLAIGDVIRLRGRIAAGTVLLVRGIYRGRLVEQRLADLPVRGGKVAFVVRGTRARFVNL